MDTTHRAAFGTVLGEAPGGVAVYSSDYASADPATLPTRDDYRSTVDGHFMGYKWQCVELARRWLYVNKGYVFDDIAMAYDIFRLGHVTVVDTGERLPLHGFANGARRAPEPGCLMIWNEGGEFHVTGHVAVVTEVLSDRVRVVEQNVEDKVWNSGQTWSRELPASVDDDGRYWIDCTYENAGIMGWVIQTDDATHAEAVTEPDPALYDLEVRTVRGGGVTGEDWLDIARPEDAVYLATTDGFGLATDPVDAAHYLCLGETALGELKRATNELHAMFMHATSFVLQREDWLRRFNLPPALWPRIHQSWDNRANEMITGRFDFAMSAAGLKVYEYNCDSASCHMETGRVQTLWAEAAGCRDGRPSGDRLTERLIEAWRASEIDGPVHIMQDADAEETYHALYMKSAMDAAGLETVVVKGLKTLQWCAGADDGRVCDAQGRPIRWVWKTWAWETALDDIRDQIEDDDDAIRLHRTIDRATTPPRLVDVLLKPDVMVFEPLWTLIPSNKAILPVLWSLYPGHPYLLESRFEPSAELAAKGYAVKPIVGRCGHNIALVDHRAEVIEETAGRFDDRDLIYQELFPLPVVGGKYQQVCTFSVDGTFAGACVRTDASPIITTESAVLPLRVVADDDLSAGAVAADRD